MISHKLKFVFVHIPRTSGTSIKCTLQHFDKNSIIGGSKTSWNYHASLQDYKNKYSIDDYFKFTIVRNTWDRLYSWYSFRPQMNQRYFLTFKQWLLEKYWCYNGHTTQLSWLYDNDTVNMDFIGHFETLQQDYSYILNKIGINSSHTLLKRNVTNAIPDGVYDDEMQEFVLTHFKTEMELFNYALVPH